MKKLMLLTAAIMIMAGFSTRMFAQSNATTAAAANIVSALILNETASLHFGSMTIPTGGAVTVTLPTTGTRVAGGTGTITLLAQSPVAHNAAYTVTGSVGFNYHITLPTSPVTISSAGNPDMTVTDFVAASNSTGGDGGTLTAGTDTFVVGGTLNLASGQGAGLYSGTFDVSVAYN